MTPVEVKLWQHLRAHRFYGESIRRQHPLGKYIVDFFCPRIALVIEIDGAHHGTSAGERRDRLRTKWLEENGNQVVRYWNNDVMRNLEGVLLDLAIRMGHGDQLDIQCPPSAERSDS